MTFLRLGLFAAAISLSSCLVTPTAAPEPADFKLSDEALSRKYRVVRKTGAVRLYAQKIVTTRDELGRETHQATGGSLLVKESQPRILAEAARISVTPEFSEAFGPSTVRKGDRLFIGQEESATIRIDGTEIIPQGATLVRAVAPEGTAAPAPAPEPAAAPAPELAEAAAQEAPQATLPPPPQPPEPAQQKPKTAAKPRPKPRAASPAKTSAPAKPTAVAAKPTPPPAKPTPPPAAAATPPAAKPKEAPAPDSSRLLNLMREPTDR